MIKLNMVMIKIYLITNDFNDKKYVGQTIKELSVRFTRHCWSSEYKKNMPIGLAIKKHGREHFKIELIEEVADLETANQQEVFWVNHYDCFSPNGYNLKAGGRKYLHMSQETKDKLSKSNKGKKRSEETKKRLSDSHKGYSPSDETKKKLSEFYKGKTPHKNTALGASLKNSKKTLWISPDDDEVEITNMRKFSQENNLNLSCIHKVIRGESPNHKGWRFVKYLDKD